MGQIRIAGRSIKTGGVIDVANALPKGAVYVEGFLDNQTTNQTVYSVTSGKKLYMTNLIFQAFNEDVNDVGDIHICDDSLCKIPLIMAAATVGVNPPVSGAINMSFPTPKEFTTDVNVAIISGTVTYSISFTGYELTI